MIVSTPLIRVLTSDNKIALDWSIVKCYFAIFFEVYKVFIRSNKFYKHLVGKVQTFGRKMDGSFRKFDQSSFP